ncbi:MAG: 50S ribosomal protein L29 [Marinilabiliaceae bacterium]|nr:50S ribosomal protein L29 [Marinilabiliaceae bacterium]
MKVVDIKGMSVAELNEKLAIERRELQQLELQHVLSPIENPMKIRQKRRDIARMMTILSQKQLTEK